MSWKFRQLKYGRAIRAKGHAFGLPYQILDPLIKGWKIALDPRSYVRRKWKARALKPLASDNPFLLNSMTAYNFFKRAQISNIDAIIKECEDIYIARSSKIDLSDPKNQFRHSLLDIQNVPEKSPILDLALSRDLVGAATHYLGAVPILGAVQLWWTPKNDLLEGSQSYHIDQVDRRQFKLFLNIRPVHLNNGPLTFLPSSESRSVFRRVKDPYGPVQDEEAYRVVPSKSALQIVGSAGDGAVVDSSRCYHFGGRARGADRLIVMIQYFPYHCVKETSDRVWMNAVNALNQTIGTTGTYRDLLLQLPPSPFKARTLE